MEQSHFSYEGRVNVSEVRATEIVGEVVEVEFLTPARITMEENGNRNSVLVSIDILNRKVYTPQGKQIQGEKIFQHLDAVNTLPEDFFQASEEIYEKVEMAEADRIRNGNQFLGE